MNKLKYLLLVSALLLGVVMASTVVKAAVTIEYYPEGTLFTLQPNEGWLNHQNYHPNLNDTGAPLDIVAAPGGGSFACRGGACPQFLEYHYGDEVSIGQLEPGTHIVLLNLLHDNPSDGRRTTIKMNGVLAHVCEEGWVAPECKFVVTVEAVYSVMFEDSVAVEMITIIPAPPTATPTNTALPPTATPTNTPPPTLVPTETSTSVPTETATNTPNPTETSTQSPTETVVPSSTPLATNTPVATSTGSPTNVLSSPEPQPSATPISDLYCPLPVPTELVGQPFSIYWLDMAGNRAGQVWSGFVSWYEGAFAEFRRFSLDMSLSETQYVLVIGGFQLEFELVATGPYSLGCYIPEAAPEPAATCVPTGCVGDEVVEQLAQITTVQLGTADDPSQLVLSQSPIDALSAELFIELEGYHIYWDEGDQYAPTAASAEQYQNYENCSFAIFPMQFSIQGDTVMFTRLPGQWLWTFQDRWPTSIGEMDSDSINANWRWLNGEAFPVATLNPGVSAEEALASLATAYQNK